MLEFLKENRWIIFVLVFVSALLGAVLSPRIALEKRLLISGKQHQDAKEWREAVEDFERVVTYAPQSSSGIEAARLGGGLCLYELKDYPRAIFFFRHIVRHSQKAIEVHWAQERLAEIFYEKLSDYPQAIVEYNRLLQANPDKEQEADYKLRLGRSYFYLGKFDQAISEVSEFLSREAQPKEKFELLMLRADSLLAEKKLDEAIEAYDQMEKEFSDKAEIYQVKLNKSLAYEDKKDWDQAMAELEAIKTTYPHPDVIALKIKSIERRKAKKKDL